MGPTTGGRKRERERQRKEGGTRDERGVERKEVKEEKVHCRGRKKRKMNYKRYLKEKQGNGRNNREIPPLNTLIAVLC